MRPVLSIFTLLRSPIKTFLSLLLLVAVSFAFVGRGAEYAATSGEINRAESSNYRTVGYIRATTKQLFSALDGYFGDGFSNQNSSYSDGVPRESVPITPEAVELAAGSRYIDTVERRHKREPAGRDGTARPPLPARRHQRREGVGHAGTYHVLCGGHLRRKRRKPHEALH